MFITKALLEDIPSIHRMEKDIFPFAWQEEDFVYEISENPFSSIYILENDKELIGYIGVWDLLDQIQITTIAVKEEYRKLGYASKLLQYCIDLSDQKGYQMMSLEVRISNKKAIALYQKYNFEIQAIRKAYYQDNHEDAYLMVRNKKEEEICR